MLVKSPLFLSPSLCASLSLSAAHSLVTIVACYVFVNRAHMHACMLFYSHIVARVSEGASTYLEGSINVVLLKKQDGCQRLRAYVDSIKLPTYIPIRILGRTVPMHHTFPATLLYPDPDPTN
jgi:hypothetical protein